jgi:hypothetical protein
MKPREVLERARSERLTWVDYDADDEPFDAGAEDGEEQRLALRPPLTVADVGEFEAQLPSKLPPEVKELLLFASGFDIGANEVAFNRYNDWGYGFLLPHVAVLDGDGRGNSWVIEINPETGEWKHVWFQCHDPAVVIYQCETLAEFINAVLDLSRFEKCKAGHRSILYDIDERCAQVWRKNSRFPTAGSLKRSPDRLLATFSASLDPLAVVADLRRPSRGDGFDWSALNAGPTPVRRAGNELVFGIQPKKSLFRRILGG